MMDISKTYKKMLIAAAVTVVFVAAFFVHALAGLSATPVVFAEPPPFVDRYAVKLSSQQTVSESGNEKTVESESTNITKDFSEQEEIVRSVFFEDKSPEILLPLFSHPDKAQRVKTALAFSKINITYTHDEESGFAQKRKQFYLDAEEQVAHIENALFEALITSAQEQTENHIPYTIAWMPGQDHETVELLAWSAKHHPHWWVRRFSVFFVVEFGQNDELATSLLSNRTHDPDYRVRKEVLDLRYRRLTGEI